MLRRAVSNSSASEVNSSFTFMASMSFAHVAFVSTPSQWVRTSKAAAWLSRFSLALATIAVLILSSIAMACHSIETVSIGRYFLISLPLQYLICPISLISGFWPVEVKDKTCNIPDWPYVVMYQCTVFIHSLS